MIIKKNGTLSRVLKELLKSIGLSRNTYQNRIMKGMPIKQALGLES